MINIHTLIVQEFKLKQWQADNTLALKEEGATIPFIARYRKERTGELDENQIRDMFDRFDYLTELEDRKLTILKSIDEQGKLTDELKRKIEDCLQKTELEDLYLPYKPKKRTRATVAREKGLEGLADSIRELNIAASPAVDLQGMAQGYISEEKGVASAEEALQGAADILAEEIAETAELRAFLRNYILREGLITSYIKDEFPEGSTKYEIYRSYSVAVREIKPHAMLALRRGEAEGVIVLDVKFDEDVFLEYMNNKLILSNNRDLRGYYITLIKDGFQRLMKNSITGEVRLEKKIAADEESISVFGTNLRQILLASPAGMRPTLAIDPGFRTGCKVVALDSTGKFMEYNTIFPFQSDYQKQQAKDTLMKMIVNHSIELVAVGNGTAGRETQEFVHEVLGSAESKPIVVMVSESGASVYSAGKTANEEFPELDLTVRGSISIGRRLQDPLAELVKIDPKAIGVGQYQHDVDQKLLKKKLEEIVESCVNYVGVDVNTASKELLMYVSGLNGTTAKKIVEWRDKHGAFKSREQLKSVPYYGDKTFEQSAGFLRIRNGDNPLDNTSVHPERYKIVEMIASEAQIVPEMITRSEDKLSKIDLRKFISEDIGLPTLKDIIEELKKPGRDPREEYKYAEFDSKIKEIKDLAEGMVLEGVVTNLTNFGAFVDIGVHQDGLIHISELADRFVKHPSDVVAVGQIVKVRVTDVNLTLRRISLSLKRAGS